MGMRGCTNHYTMWLNFNNDTIVYLFISVRVGIKRNGRKRSRYT